MKYIQHKITFDLICMSMFFNHRKQHVTCLTINDSSVHMILFSDVIKAVNQ